MAHVFEETRTENKSELRELEDLFAWATKVGWGEVLSEEFVYLEDTDDDPLLVRRSAVTSIWPSGKNSTTYIALGGKRIAVEQGVEERLGEPLGLVDSQEHEPPKEFLHDGRVRRRESQELAVRRVHRRPPPLLHRRCQSCCQSRGAWRGPGLDRSSGPGGSPWAPYHRARGPPPKWRSSQSRASRSVPTPSARSAAAGPRTKSHSFRQPWLGASSRSTSLSLWQAARKCARWSKEPA